MTLKVRSLRDMMLDPQVSNPAPIIEGLLYKTQFNILSAKSKVGKSLLASNLAVSVVTGTPFLGKFTAIRGKVLMVQTEVAPHFLVQRIEKMVGEFDETMDWNEMLLISFDRVQLDTPEGWKQLYETVETYTPDLLILDPFYTLHTSDENVAKEITPILAGLGGLAQSYNIGVLLIHHQGKSGEMSNGRAGHRHRGSSAFGDVPDGSWSMSPAGPRTASLSFEFRNRPSIGSLTIQHDESLIWRFDGKLDDIADDQETIEDLFKRLFGSDSVLPRINLSQRFITHTGKTDRTFGTKLKIAEERGIVKRETLGTQVIIRHCATDRKPEISIGNFQSSNGSQSSSDIDSPNVFPHDGGQQ